MTAVTRTRLDRCATPDCPWKDDEEIHEPWCREIAGVEHRPPGTHQHWPKKGMGGRNSKSRIVAILCWPCHDRIDNGTDWGNAVTELPNGERWYRIWDLHGEVLFEKQIGVSHSEGEGSGVDPAVGTTRLPAPALLNDEDTEAPGEGVGPPAPSPLPYEPYKYGDKGLEFEPEITFEQWTEAWLGVEGIEANHQWWQGDAANRGEVFGDRCWQYLDGKGIKYSTLRNCMRVCKVYPLSRRRGVSFGHHALLIALPEKEQDKWLSEAEDKGWTRARLREAAFGRKPKTVRWTLEELRELAIKDWALLDPGDGQDMAGWQETDVARFLNWLDT